MNSTQYTIRSIPPKVDRALRKKSQMTCKSLNQVAIEALSKGSVVSLDDTFDDLNWFVGSLSNDPKFDEAMDWMRSLPVDNE